MGIQSDPNEIAANNQARAWLFPNGFEIASTSAPDILQAASRYNVHPSVVIGYLQHANKQYSLYRKRICKVRSTLQDAGLLLA